MTEFQLFALTESGCQPLPVPAGATSFDDLYEGLALGVYSVLRTFDHNKFLKLDEHLKRTEKSILLIGWEEKLARSRLCEGIHQICTASPLPEMRVRYDILAEPAWNLGTDSRLLVAVMPLKAPSPQMYEKGVAVGLAAGLSRQQPLAKTADFARESRVIFKQERDFEDYLILNEEGYILEGTSSNFYGIREGTVWTAGEGVLEGITRQIILELLGELDIPLYLEPISVQEIDTLEEAAISSSSRGWLPVVRIADSPIGSGLRGPISGRLIAAYHDYIAKNIKTAIDC